MRYSKPHKKLMDAGKVYKKEISTVGRKRAREIFFEKMVSLRMKMGQRQKSAEHLANLDLSIISVISEKKWLTVYVEDEVLLRFLEGSELKNSDADVVLKAAEKIANIGLDGIMIHLPERDYSIMCFAGTAPKGWRAIGIQRGEDIGDLAISPDAPDIPSHIKDTNDGMDMVWRVVINLAMYMDAFPETVRDGVPALPTKPNRPADRRKSHIIYASQPIIDAEKMYSVSPHMRRGHFRLLSDERYTQKRGQTVYVKPTMVRGSAKTVETIS